MYFVKFHGNAFGQRVRQQVRAHTNATIQSDWSTSSPPRPRYCLLLYSQPWCRPRRSLSPETSPELVLPASAAPPAFGRGKRAHKRTTTLVQSPFHHRHHIWSIYLIFLAFNRIVSSFTKTPSPLSGLGFPPPPNLRSELLNGLLVAPPSKIRVGCGVEASTPLGTPISTGYAYPSLQIHNSLAGV
ncbi:hypothetical protein AYO21_11517 [Fonsecaea monophora]|uniref:Uncharacterized protein n=1 Tax=Fonsecaea monophora TaxID=254056 RepID=A0A177EQU9_9EURO|nr:hypothetical protein AYO21_11517 [Fonsecaea monophora]OAG34337.1 hypothetical protein AYO21_11517 [Fonsecaea monophora]